MRYLPLLLSFLLCATLSLHGQSWTQRGGNHGFSATEIGLGVPVDLNGDGTVRATADYNDNTDRTHGGIVRISRWSNDRWQAMGNQRGIQSQIPDEDFGRSISLSASGEIIAIGAYGPFSDRNGFSRAYVYQFDGNDWVPRGTPVRSDQVSSLGTGAQVSLSADGNRLVFAEHWHDRGENDGTLAGPNYGIIRVFEWNGQDWSPLGNPILGQFRRSGLGSVVTLSADGNTLAASDSGTDDTTFRVYRWDGRAWNQTGASIPASGALADLSFEGGGVSLSGDGNVAVISFPNYYGEGDEGGQVSVYAWNGFAWERRGATLIDDEKYSAFGTSVDVSFDGKTIVVGSPFRRFDLPDNFRFRAYAEIFHWDGSAHNRVGEPIFATQTNKRFGHSVAISGDGQVVNLSTDFTESNYGRVYAYDGVVSADRPRVSAPTSLFPNPASDYIRVSLPEGGDFSVTIIDAVGRKHSNTHRSFVTDHPTLIPLPALAAGVYRLVVTGGLRTYQSTFGVVQ